MSAVYEGIILFGIVFFFGYGFSALTTFKGEDGTLRIAFQVYLFLVLGAYFVGFWSDARRSLPMKTMAIALATDADGTPVGKLRAAWRYVVASLFFWGILAAVWKASIWWLVLWPLPFAWAAFDREHRTLYDLAAGTRLVRTS